MKRLWVAVALLIAVMGLCVATRQYQKRQVNALLDVLDASVTAFNNGDGEEPRMLVTRFCEEYTWRTKLFPCFMSHADLEGLRESVAILPATLAGESTEEFLLEAARCRALLERLLAVERPGWQNIL